MLDIATREGIEEALRNRECMLGARLGEILLEEKLISAEQLARGLALQRTVIEASLTGHFVLSTMHTNSAAESMVRLLDFGLALSISPMRWSACSGSAWCAGCAPPAAAPTARRMRRWTGWAATPEIKKLISAKANVAALTGAAMGQGMRSLRQDGIEKMLLGQTDWPQLQTV